MVEVNKIANAVLEYETKFDGGLKFQYKSDNEFLNDLVKEIKENGNDDLLGYYKTYLVSMNDTNSTKEKRSEIRKLISLLES